MSHGLKAPRHLLAKVNMRVVQVRAEFEVSSFRGVWGDGEMYIFQLPKFDFIKVIVSLA